MGEPTRNESEKVTSERAVQLNNINNGRMPDGSFDLYGIATVISLAVSSIIATGHILYPEMIKELVHQVISKEFDKGIPRGLMAWTAASIATVIHSTYLRVRKIHNEIWKNPNYNFRDFISVGDGNTKGEHSENVEKE